MEKYLPKINRSPVIEKVKLTSSIESVFGCFSELADAAFLNSSLETDAGRYSFIGIDPFLTLRGKGKELQMNFNGHTFLSKEDPFKCLESIIRTYKVDNPTSLPFISGGIGYLSYDLKDAIETLPQKAKDDLKLPDIYFAFYRTLFIHDKKDPGHLYISITTDGSDTSRSISEYKKIIENIPEVHNAFETPESYTPELRPEISKTDYMDSVKKVLDYIRAGDIYQVCLSQRFRAGWPFAPYELYRKLNDINPAPFSAYLNFNDGKIISSSPERFLHVADNIIETRPMKGTRPRSAEADKDAALKEQLRTSIKDDAELSMIVDLERNDLGKVSVPGSVEVVEHRRLETYPTVFQTISIVKGTIERDTSMIDVIKASFPGGSITGCPKIRAMKIIDELEPTTRSAYTGSIGYLSFHETMDLNIAIRTMIIKENDVYFQVGGGIVADSDPSEEYEETIHKARAMMESLKACEMRLV
ncbi:MAG: aminodeoxychorismate synthase component I [Candidatus Omnitrophota bacterium]